MSFRDSWTHEQRRRRSSAALLASGLLAAAAPTAVPAQNIDLSLLGTVHPGFRITGIDAGDYSGYNASGAGDVNGDGFADLIIGAPFADPGGDERAGECYVIFGKADNIPLHLVALGSRGFRIDGIDAEDSCGWSVSGAGDVNGDGFADLILGAPTADPGGGERAGESYVVFGKADTNTVDLAALGNNGFRIDGIDIDDRSGRSVSSAGDVNGDGFADLIVGAYSADPGDGERAGESYVVFGKADTNTVDLAALGNNGFRIDGIDAEDRSGRSVSSAGDVNGDGLADLIVGAPTADPGGDERAGESYVVFGKVDNNTIDLAALGNNGFRIDGIDVEDRSGSSVSGAGDVNGDGLADLIIGADLAALGNGGFRIDGSDAFDYSGRTVSGAGDVNGDGLADLLVGATFAEPGGEYRAGENYVVFSPVPPPDIPTWKGFARQGDAPPLAPGVTGDGSNDSTPDSRCWIDFADGSGTGLSSASLVTVKRESFSTKGTTGLPQDALPVRWEVTTERTEWSSAELTFRYLDSEFGDPDEGALSVYTSPNPNGPWTILDTDRDAARNRVSSTVDSFGFFVIAADPEAIKVLWSLY